MASPNGSWESKIFIEETRVGKGVFANRHFKTDAIIGEVTGELIHDAEYTSSYCIDMGDDIALEPAPPFRFLNHSCDPNCELFVYDDDLFKLLVVSLRPIRRHEELTIDYGWPAEVAIPCQCGSDVCRGWVVDPEDLPLLLEEKAEEAKAMAQEQQALHQKNSRRKSKAARAAC